MPGRNYSNWGLPGMRRERRRHLTRGHNFGVEGEGDSKGEGEREVRERTSKKKRGGEGEGEELGVVGGGDDDDNCWLFFGCSTKSPFSDALILSTENFGREREKKKTTEKIERISRKTTHSELCTEGKSTYTAEQQCLSRAEIWYLFTGRPCATFSKGPFLCKRSGAK